MRIPFWLLKLLPLFDYICPRCKKEVEKNSSKCPYCGEQYGNPVRVPPRLLKDPKALEDYVHKHIFPRVSKAQRDYLTQYFTEVFSDGFESGDFSQWTGTNGTPSIVESPVHHGTYAMQINADQEYVYKDFGSSYSEIYARLYVYFDSLPTSTNYIIELLGVGDKDNWTYLAEVEVKNTDGTNVYFQLHVGGVETVVTDVLVQTGTWYCVEIKRVTGSGSCYLYIDDEEEAEAHYAYYDADRIKVGGSNSLSKVATFDCVVVADTYIGPEEEGATYTKTWNADVLFKKLDITKSLDVDATIQKQGIPKTFGVDVAFQKSFIIQKQTDVLFKKFNVLKSFAVDAHFGALMTQTTSRQIDVLLKKMDVTENFGLDVYFGPVEAETYAKNFALDVIFAYKVRLPELWLDENGNFVLNISKPYAWVGT